MYRFDRGIRKRRKIFLSEVVVLLELVLVTVATNATSERSFSALRRLKTYLCSTMAQLRLNHSALPHTTKEECDTLKEHYHDFTYRAQMIVLNV